MEDKCSVCGIIGPLEEWDENRLLKCCRCPRGYHLFCLDPPLLRHPNSSLRWQCPAHNGVHQLVDSPKVSFALPLGFFLSFHQLNNKCVTCFTFKQYNCRKGPKEKVYIIPREAVSLSFGNSFWAHTQGETDPPKDDSKPSQVFTNNLKKTERTTLHDLTFRFL